ncbi:hypothetical protein VTN00DRAFT_2319 [Thermoascus crustaceus]|uniref:uncharacterized protein n=1 Tax=Thermoascus crustaceus TaxID=5088 RepID=UPI003742076A
MRRWAKARGGLKGQDGQATTPESRAERGEGCATGDAQKDTARRERRDLQRPEREEKSREGKDDSYQVAGRGRLMGPVSGPGLFYGLLAERAPGNSRWELRSKNQIRRCLATLGACHATFAVGETWTWTRTRRQTHHTDASDNGEACSTGSRAIAEATLDEGLEEGEGKGRGPSGSRNQHGQQPRDGGGYPAVLFERNSAGTASGTTSPDGLHAHEPCAAEAPCKVNSTYCVHPYISISNHDFSEPDAADSTSSDPCDPSRCPITISITVESSALRTPGTPDVGADVTRLRRHSSTPPGNFEPSRQRALRNQGMGTDFPPWKAHHAAKSGHQSRLSRAKLFSYLNCKLQDQRPPLCEKNSRLFLRSVKDALLHAGPDSDHFRSTLQGLQRAGHLWAAWATTFERNCIDAVEVPGKEIGREAVGAISKSRNPRRYLLRAPYFVAPPSEVRFETSEHPMFVCVTSVGVDGPGAKTKQGSSTRCCWEPCHEACDTSGEHDRSHARGLGASKLLACCSSFLRLSGKVYSTLILAICQGGPRKEDFAAPGDHQLASGLEPQRTAETTGADRPSANSVTGLRYSLLSSGQVPIPSQARIQSRLGVRTAMSAVTRRPSGSSPCSD